MDTDDEAPRVPRDSGNWAAKVDRLRVPDEVSRFGYNVEGKRVAGPQQGFGRLWQRTYRASLGSATTPETLVRNWRADFGSFWPRSGRFHGAMTSLQPGDVAPLTASGLSTGILVLYADDTSFTFLTPEGHMFAAMITFSGEPEQDGTTTAQIRILLRTADPIFETMWPIARRQEDAFWSGTLRNLAAAHGVPGVVVSEHSECVDRGRLWGNWRNVRYNTGIRTVWHGVTRPFRPHPHAAA
jgi:hypothetical protein